MRELQGGRATTRPNDLLLQQADQAHLLGPAVGTVGYGPHGTVRREKRSHTSETGGTLVTKIHGPQGPAVSGRYRDTWGARR